MNLAKFIKSRALLLEARCIETYLESFNTNSVQMDWFLEDDTIVSLAKGIVYHLTNSYGEESEEYRIYP